MFEDNQPTFIGGNIFLPALLQFVKGATPMAQSPMLQVCSARLPVDLLGSVGMRWRVIKSIIQRSWTSCVGTVTQLLLTAFDLMLIVSAK